MMASTVTEMNSIPTITKDYELKQYKKWTKNFESKSAEIFAGIQWFICVIAPTINSVCIICTNTNYTIFEHISIILITCFIYPFIFVSGHVLVHTKMLINYKFYGKIVSKWGYFHHYVDSSLFSKYPYNYRRLYIKNMVFIMIGWIILYPNIK